MDAVRQHALHRTCDAPWPSPSIRSQGVLLGSNRTQPTPVNPTQNHGGFPHVWMSHGRGGGEERARVQEKDKKGDETDEQVEGRDWSLPWKMREMCGPGCAYVVEEPSPPPMGSVHRGEEWYVEAIRSLLHPRFLLDGNPKGNGRKRRSLLHTTKLAKFSVRKTDTFMSQMPTLGVARLRKTLPPSQLGSQEERGVALPRAGFASPSFVFPKISPREAITSTVCTIVLVTNPTFLPHPPSLLVLFFSDAFVCKDLPARPSDP